MSRLSAGFLLLLSSLLPWSVFAQPASLSASIGMPANGDAHHIALTWAELQGASSYEVQSSPNNIEWSPVYTGTLLTYSHNSGTEGNTPYYYRVRATVNGSPTAWRNAAQFPIYSACDFPALPVLSNPGFYSMSIALTLDGNPSNTTYSIYCATNAKYVQANGALGTTEVFQTMTAWGVVSITGLEHSTAYCFYAKAKNQDGDIRFGSEAFMYPESFNNNANFQASTGSIFTKFWSPGACTGGGLEFSATGGCTNGNIGYRKSFNNKFDCWLRTPEVNCSGATSAVLKFDLTNSWFVDHPNDRIRFYLWDNNYVTGLHSYHATSVKINGVEKGVVDENGIYLYFDEARTCATVEVTYDFAQVGLTNTSKVLFYMQPSCGYHDMRMYNVKFDNISVQRSISSACLSTSFCTAASIETQPEAKNGCINGTTTFNLGTIGNVASYQWQVSTNSGGSWNNITDNFIYSNSNTSVLTLTGIMSNMNGYLYRCIATGACSSVLTSDQALLQTLQYAPSPAGTISGSTSVCQGDTGIAFNVPLVNGADAYTWSLPADATITSGEGTNRIRVSFGTNSVNGSIIVIPTSACGQGTPSPAFNLTVNPLPSMPGEIAGSASSCGSTNQTYSIDPVSNATHYTWLLPGGWAGTSASTSINATTNGSGGTIIVTANSGCGSSLPRTLTVLGNVGPSVPGPITGGVDVCEGDSFTVSIDPVAGADYYTWELPDGWTGNSTANNITMMASTSGGMVLVTAHNNCGASAPQSKTLSLKPAPDVVFNMSLQAICKEDAAFPLTTGTPVGGVYSGTGIIHGILFPEQAEPGVHLINYTCTSESGCSATDTAVLWIEVCSGLGEAQDENMFSVYPNPFKELLVIKLNNINEPQTITLCNALGKEISETLVPAATEEFRLDVPPSAASGLVFVKVTSQSGKTSGVKKVLRAY